MRPRRIVARLAALGAYMITGVAGPVHAGVALQLTWSHEYGAENTVWYQHGAVALSGPRVIVGGEREDRAASTSDAWMFEIDPNGGMVVQGAIGSGYRTVRALSPTDGSLYAVALGADGQLSLLKRGADRKVVATQEFSGAEEALVFVRLVQLADRRVLAVGRDEKGAVAIGAAADGKGRFEKRSEALHLDAFVDAVAEPNGGFVLVGNTQLSQAAPALEGQAQSAASTPQAMVWVGKYRGDGTRGAERQLAGRDGSIVRLREGGYALLYDRGRGTQQEVVLQRLTDDLRDLWSSEVLRASTGYQHFKLGTLANGDFVAVGGKDDQPFVAMISASGQRLADFVGDTMLRSASYDVVTAGDAIFVVSTVFVEFTDGGKRDAAQKVRVMRMDPKRT